MTARTEKQRAKAAAYRARKKALREADLERARERARLTGRPPATSDNLEPLNIKKMIEARQAAERRWDERVS